MEIKGKILYKMKILEKFCLALISPCSKSIQSNQACLCYRTEIKPHVETAYALTSSEVGPLGNLENKRAQLIADIMDNEEMKEILSFSSLKTDTDKIDECNNMGFILDSYSIETENLKRLRDLQKSYEELMVCYENLKRERDILQNRCSHYNDLESEIEQLRYKLREYNDVWQEKEHFQRRSDDLDTLKEKFIVLSEETLNLETQLKAECEINAMKASKITELANDNINLEIKISNITIAFEKEKILLECKLQEAECKIMCQEEQIKSMSTQIDRLLEQETEKVSFKIFQS